MTWIDDAPDGSLEDLNVLVAGGAGNVGTHIVGALLAAGATVIVPSRTGERLERLREAVAGRDGDRLITLEGTISDERDAPRLLDEAERRAGPLGAAVASLGAWASAPSVLEAAREDLERAVEGYLMAHFLVARAVLPRLRERGGAYVFINGPLAWELRAPPTALVSIASAGQAMLARAVMRELADEPARVNELVLYAAVGWGEADERSALKGEDVGRYVAHLVSERAADVRGETIHLRSPEQLAELSPEGDGHPGVQSRAPGSEADGA